MTMTGLRIDVVPVQAETDEAEIAAAIACVFAVMKQRQANDSAESERLRQESLTDSSNSPNNWGRASRFEGSGQGTVTQSLKMTSTTRSAWWSSRSGLLSILSVGIAITVSTWAGSAALAQNYEGETDPAGGEVETAPSFRPASETSIFKPAIATSLNSQVETGEQALPTMAALPAPNYSQSSVNAGVAMPSYPVSQLLPSRSGQIIRVLITRGGKTPELACLDGASITALDSMTPVAEIAAGSRFQLRSEGNRLAFGGNDLFSVAKTNNSGPIRQVVAMTPRLPLGGYERLAGTVNKFSLPFDAPGAELTAQRTQVSPPIKGAIKPSGYLVVPKGKDGLVSISGKVYRGAIWLRPVRTVDGIAIRVVNLVDLEDYLLSVVPSEMPASWHLEALKAQSIAARSYAVANLGKNEKDCYDVKDTIDDQVYLGVESETPSGNRACDETSSVVLRHNQKVISAFFHSTSGGTTEVSENVWSREVPYLQSVADYDDSSPHFSWQRKFPIDQAEKSLSLKPGSLLTILPLTRVSSMRVKNAFVIGTDGTTMLTGERLRQLFKLPSSIFNVSFEDNHYVFAGRGFGHGLGMSQYGAKTLAESGYNAAQILAYYYRDVSVEYLNRSPGI